MRMKKKKTIAVNYIAAILTFVIALAVSLSIFLAGIQQSIESNSQTAMTTNVSRQSDHLLSILNIHYGFLNSIADKMGNATSLLSKGNMALLSSLTEHTDFERTALIEPDGTAHYDNGAEKNVSQRKYFQDAINGEETLSDPLESSVDQETRVILCVPVYQDNEIIAVLGGSYNVTTLSRLLFNDVFDDSGYSLIVNGDGQIIAYDGQPSYQKITYGDNFFTLFENKTHLTANALEQVKTDFTTGRNGLIKMRNGSDRSSDQYLAYTKLGLNNWMICYVIPVADAQSSYDFVKSDETILLGVFCILVLMLVFYIIRKNRQKNEELLKSAQIDGLTETLNKRTTEAYINDILTNMPEEKGAFIILDVDKFKEVNDHYGHATGDLVLSELGKLFRKFFREDDIVGRIGGDEFVIYMRKMESKAGASSRIEKLLDNVRQLTFKEMDDGHISISVGIAFAPEHGNCYMDLYKNADTALYETKQNGRDGYHMYNSTKNQAGNL